MTASAPRHTTDQDVSDQDVALGSDLVTYAARLIRAVRQHVPLGASVRILSILDQHGPLGVTALAEVDRCSQPTMSAAVRQLVEQGWAAKAANPDDARSSIVALTDTGRAELRRAREANGRLVATRLAERADHPSEEVRIAVAVLRDLVDAPLRSPADPEGVIS